MRALELGIDNYALFLCDIARFKKYNDKIHNYVRRF